ncbi:MAG: 16S rRNA (guanine(966)-N(2))-methyltransferase RsmD [Desulfobacterales bacterium]|nr:MAG: 16S rRNA (guanine(966)-N(2))-methyltransferase RsmD [Desulfobacterales bacterium]
MRIISGIYRGRKLIPIKGKDIRPTTDRARESLFNILGNEIFQARVLDLFAGTGAVGIEALSRGASQVIFADQSRTACQVIKENLAHCCQHQDPDKITKILCTDILAPDFFSSFAPESFDLIFLDPPYHRGMAGQLMKNSNFLSCLSPGGMIIAEHSPREQLQDRYHGLDFSRMKKYGNSMFSFFTMSSSIPKGNTHAI